MATTTSDVTLQQLIDQTAAFVNSIQDDPNARLQARKDFYTQYPGTNQSQYGYGHSEIDFMNWEITRGVLNPMNAAKPGSQWWRQVNLTLIFNAKLADLITQSGQTFSGVPSATLAWLSYIQDPTPHTWYIAHNVSISTGYISCTADALLETQYEQMFMNEVISRLFYAQAMVEGRPYAFGKLGEFLANPAGDAVDAMVHMPDFYPINYPLTAQDIIHVTHQGHDTESTLENILDEVLIGQNLVTLFNDTATLLAMPELTNFIVNDKMVYPNIQQPARATA